MRVTGDAELLAVDSDAQLNDSRWRDDTGLFPPIAPTLQMDEGQHSLELIDADGRVFSMRANESGKMEYLSTEQRYEITDVLEIVRQYAAMQGHCCVAKIGAKSIRQAIQLVEHLNNE